MRQDAQKSRRKFCAPKTAKKRKTHPEKPEKGETGCVFGAGGDGNGWKRIKPGTKTSSLNQNESHSHTIRAKRKPAKTQCFRRFFGRGRRDRRWTQPTGLQVPTTRTAGEPAGAPCCQDVPPNDKKQRHCKSSSAIFGRGRRTWSRLPARVLLPGGERPAPTGAGAETGSRRSATGARSPLGTRFWSGCGNSAQRAGEGQGCAVLPAKPQNGRCWFGAVRKNEWIERTSAICHRMIASICDLYYNITKQDRLAYVERISCELLLRILRALPMFQRME